MWVCGSCLARLEEQLEALQRVAEQAQANREDWEQQCVSHGMRREDVWEVHAAPGTLALIHALDAWRGSNPASDPRDQVETFEDGSPLIVGPNHLASNQESSQS